MHWNNLKIFTIAVGSFLFFACEEKVEQEHQFIYTGPTMAVQDLDITYLDSGQVTVKMSTAEQLKLQNEDEKYPKAIYVNFINENGVEYSNLRADSGKYFKKDNYYLMQGNVFFYNVEAQQSLSTNELIWKPEMRKIYSEKRVQVNTPYDQIVGNGLEAEQDFSRYKFTGNITGFFQVDSLITSPDPAQSRVLND